MSEDRDLPTPPATATDAAPALHARRAIGAPIAYRAPLDLAAHSLERLVAEVCTRVANGELPQDLLSEPHLPSWVQWWGLVAQHDWISELFTRAREQHGHFLAWEKEKLARGVLAGEVDYRAAQVVDNAFAWGAGKFAARYYNDKFGAGDAPSITIITSIGSGAAADGERLAGSGTYALTLNHNMQSPPDKGSILDNNSEPSAVQEDDKRSRAERKRANKEAWRARGGRGAAVEPPVAVGQPAGSQHIAGVASQKLGKNSPDATVPSAAAGGPKRARAKPEASASRPSAKGQR